MIDEISAVQKLYKANRLDRSLYLRIAFFILLTIICGVIAFFDVFSYKLDWLLSLLIWALGFYFGKKFLSKAVKIEWDKTRAVMTVRRLDRVSLIIFGSYIIFRIVFYGVLDASSVSAIKISGLTFCFLFGLTFGRLLEVCKTIRTKHKNKN